MALIRTLNALEKLNLKGDEKTGIEILKKALEEPMKLIAQNAGKEGAVVVEEVKKHKNGYGFNTQTLIFEDLMENGIIDPTKVVRLALENAASGAAMLLTTECVIVEKPEKKEEKPSSMPEEY